MSKVMALLNSQRVTMVSYAQYRRRLDLSALLMLPAVMVCVILPLVTDYEPQQSLAVGTPVPLLMGLKGLFFLDYLRIGEVPMRIVKDDWEPKYLKGWRRRERRRKIRNG